jgi:transcriptional regulator GlxA family with amidase domain
MNARTRVVDTAIAAALDALPQRLSVREMAAAAGVSLGTLQRAFEQAYRTTPVFHVQQLSLHAARRDLEKATPGDTVFGIARRWGFSSPDSAFRAAYWAAYRERPSDTLKRARTLKARENSAPIFNDHVTCLECGKTMRRLRRHIAIAHDLTPDMYRQRWGLRHDHPLVCAELSRQIARRARAGGLAGKGARARKPWKNAKSISRRDRINGDALPPALLVRKVEKLVLAALPVRLSERYLAERLSVGLRTLRRAFLDERGGTAHVALRQLRLWEAQRRLEAEPALTLKAAAQQCGFGHYARFWRDLEVCQAAAARTSSSKTRTARRSTKPGSPMLILQPEGA